MTAPEMHVLFRQYAQQMGLQHNRAILPEQIDIMLNTAILDTVNQLLKERVANSNDRVVTDNSKIGQVNGLSTLYNVKSLDLIDAKDGVLPFTYSRKNYFNGLYESNAKYNFPDALFWIDFSINYCKASTGWSVNNEGDIIPPTMDTSNDEFVTNFYPVRLIEDTYLSDTLNDFVLKNRFRSPVLIIYKDDFAKKTKFDLYIDKFDKDTSVLENGFVPYQFRMSYVAKPAIVKFNEDINAKSVDCDLPEFMHVDIVKHAVDLYRVAVSSSLYARQQQNDAQSRENYRNNN